jgi:hypothetical protein
LLLLLRWVSKKAMLTSFETLEALRELLPMPQLAIDVERP